jgi:hypothetical protein
MMMLTNRVCAKPSATVLCFFVVCMTFYICMQQFFHLLHTNLSCYTPSRDVTLILIMLLACAFGFVACARQKTLTASVVGEVGIIYGAGGRVG